MRALSGAPTLRVCVEQALQSSSSQTHLNRGSGELFESEFAALLTEEMQVRISAEAIKAIKKKAPGYGTVKSIKWRWLGGGRKPADFLVTIEGTKMTVTLPVNLKKQVVIGFANWYSAVSTNTLVRVASGLEIVSPKTLKRISTDRTLLEFAAGERLIQPSDYFILNVRVTQEGELVEIESQGLLSHVMEVDGKLRLAVRRQPGHPSDLVYWRTQTILPDDFDVNAAFLDALLPTPLSEVEIALQTIARRRANGEQFSSLQSFAASALQ